MNGRFGIQWRLRTEPLQPAALAAVGAAADQLLRQVLARDDSAIRAWKGVSTPDSIVLLGEEPTLPWVDGVIYLGRNPVAPQLLLPTTHDPGVPPDLLERALVRRCPFPPPLALFAERVISLSEAGELHRPALLRWLARR